MDFQGEHHDRGISAVRGLGYLRVARRLYHALCLVDEQQNRCAIRIKLCRGVQELQARDPVRHALRGCALPCRLFSSSNSSFQPLRVRAVGAAHRIHSTDELLGGGLAFGSEIAKNQACLRHDTRDSHPDLPTRSLHCVGNLASRLSARLHRLLPVARGRKRPRADAYDRSPRALIVLPGIEAQCESSTRKILLGIVKVNRPSNIHLMLCEVGEAAGFTPCSSFSRKGFDAKTLFDRDFCDICH